MQQADDKHGPGLKFPPPLLALGVIGLFWLVDLLLPLPIVDDGGLWLSGAAIVFVALLILVISLVHFLEAKTHIEPWHPTTAIIQKGIYRFSRNPVYLAFCIATVGCGLILNSWWVVFGVLPLCLLLQQLVIGREEIYLENKFGEEYLAYKRRVRRWF